MLGFLCRYPGAVKRAMERFVAHAEWWAARLSFCRYSNVPVGNLPADPVQFGCDVAFARALKENNHLLWFSESTRPDLGGLEGDENWFAEEFSNPTLALPGAYRHVCADLDIAHMAVNSIMQSNFIEEMEGGMGLQAVEDAALGSEAKEGEAGLALAAGSLHLTYATRAAFKVLKSMIALWYLDAIKHADREADALISSFYRWLRSPAALAFDPALAQMVHKHMQKVFMQLVARFRKLRATVVYASFTSITLSTGKETTAAALAYLKYILEAVHSRPLFQLLTLEVTLLWHSYLFLDAANFGGLTVSADGGQPGPAHLPAPAKPAALPHSPDLADGKRDTGSAMDGVEGESCDEGAPRRGERQAERGSTELDRFEEVEEASPRSQSAPEEPAPLSQGSSQVVANWDIARYLPRLCEDYFIVAIHDFLLLPHQQRLLIEAEGVDSQSAAFQTPQEKQAMHDAYVRDELVSVRLTRQLLGYLQDIRLRLSGQQAPLQFPVLAGSHLAMVNPALEFTKIVTHVMKLDSAAVDAVQKLQSSMLRLIGAHEFSREATFINPCLSFVLPAVVCSYCLHSRDLDLTRDKEVTDGSWMCAVCSHPYNLELIESALVEIVSRRSAAYQVQDLVCIACRKVKNVNTGTSCNCSGVYACTERADVFRSSLRVFKNIAQYYGFTWLQETIAFITAV